MTNETKEQIKDITIKVVLTIPALIIGIIGAILMILKPVITLWSPKEES